VTNFPKKEFTAVPPLCAQHTSVLIHRVLMLKPEDPWQSALVICNILLFQAAMADQRVHDRTEGDMANMSLVLAELGPLCCALRTGILDRIFGVMRKGLTHAALVTQRKVADPDFDMTTMSSTLRVKGGL
jgi:hypothetical protein